MYDASKNHWVYKKFDGVKYISLLVKDYKLLKNMSKFWIKSSLKLEMNFIAIQSTIVNL